MTKRGKFDYILLETTGLADPGMLLIPFCLFVWGDIQNNYFHCLQLYSLMTTVGCSIASKNTDTASFDSSTFAVILTVWDVFKIQRSRFDSQHYQIFWEVVGLERGPLSLVSTVEELLGRKSSGSGLENWDYGRRQYAALTTRPPPPIIRKS
jgi:hypothetical protein